MTDIETPRWSAVQQRDKNADFVFAVRTTRIACRPGCPSRTPRRENVQFFGNFEAAQAAGFRACKRCAPDDIAADAERRRLVNRACALLDADEASSFEAVSREIGLSRFHFQRIFRAVLGVTPGEYRRARRVERLREGLAHGRSVTEAIQAAGFGSASRAYEAKALGMTPSSFRAGARGERIAYAVAASTLGRVLVARTAAGICAIALGDDDATVLATLRRDFPHADLVVDEDELADNLSAVLARIDRGDELHPQLAFDVRGTAFQRRVWNALRAIPTGERWSYAQVAAAMGRPGSARAVAAACAENRIAVALACHRVVGTHGELRGYRWGVARKAELLRREASVPAGREAGTRAPRLPDLNEGSA
ncbi:MAG: bifunctional DNA-binding transcriptional regulator/O6-methylguanine-DNA methyltransferase Ada [Candidatus Eremiobacteraeota bacterium]|nr:bifunctional DNA-binding transcriptional regulator/O6-methylguanine-DNA methyltransferase Ada [Candidatus Eremiobacteraeota bacterium]